MRNFIRQHTDHPTRLGEALFGLVMALGFTGAVRFGIDEADNWTLFKSILGCNIAWGIVDGAMVVLASLLERGRKGRVVQTVLTAANEDQALSGIATELDERFAPYTTREERREIYGWVLKLVKRGGIETSGLNARDFLAGLVVALLIILITLPVVLPFLVIRDTYWAVRFSNLIGVALLFSLGTWWGRLVGLSPIKMGAVMALLGTLLVLITIALGG